VETLIFSVAPEMSYSSPELVARDPNFWSRKSTQKKRVTPASE